MLTKIQIMTLNDIIHGIHILKDMDEMRKKTLETIRYIVPYTSASFYLADPRGTNFIFNPIGVDIDMKVLKEYMENCDADYSKHLFSNGRSMVYKDSDFFPPEDVADTEYYKYIYEQHNVKDLLTLSIGDHGRFLGVITLYRNDELRDFSEQEVFLMSLLICHFESRLAREYARVLHKDNLYNEAELEDIKKKYSLTEREGELLDLLLKGNSIDEICQLCSISSNTLRKHITNIYRKLGIHSRPELAKLFYK